jgi:hypothetical protein
VANYIAKYATKTLTVPGVPDTRIRTAFDLQGLRCSRHHREMITAAWQLGSRHATGEPRFRQWAHMLGYGGHFLTKSRRYSVTFGVLRTARTAHRRAQRHPGGERDPWGRPLDESVVLVLSTWTYAGPATPPPRPPSWPPLRPLEHASIGRSPDASYSPSGRRTTWTSCFTAPRKRPRRSGSAVTSCTT